MMTLYNDFEIILTPWQLKDILRTARDRNVSWFNIDAEENKLNIYDTNNNELLSLEVELKELFRMGYE